MRFRPHRQGQMLGHTLHTRCRSFIRLHTEISRGSAAAHIHCMRQATVCLAPDPWCTAGHASSSQQQQQAQGADHKAALPSGPSLPSSQMMPPITAAVSATVVGSGEYWRELCEGYAAEARRTALARKGGLGEQGGERRAAVPMEAYELLRQCLEPNPAVRISASKALSHPFFQGGS